MIFLIFQIADLLTALLLVSAQLGFATPMLLFYHASYLMIKGGWYWTDPMSWIDILVGVYLLLMILGVKSVFSYVAAAYFLYKFATYLMYS